jgi:APA family basic amino acid/polyamine antiporter
VAADTAVHILGPVGFHLITFVVMITIFGCINSSVLTVARVYYAMAQDGLFFRWCASVHPRFRTPYLALVAQAVWSVLLVTLGNYEQLYTYAIFAAWVFYALTAFGVIVLRRKRPDLPRPYRVFGYPWVPMIFVLAAAWFIVNTLIEKPVEAGLGSLIVALGVPVYLIWKRRSGPQER